MNKSFDVFLLACASGVMVAASIWSLLLPSIELAKGMGHLSFIPAAVGFLLGILFLILIDGLVKHLSKNKRSNSTLMLAISVTLHNIPEGMAVGVAFAGAMLGQEGITIVGAMVTSIGIAIQNIPEGAIISLPIKMEGKSKGRAFMFGTISGIVEPIAAGITLVLSSIIASALPYLLSFAAGAMVFVVINELLPDANEKRKSYLDVISFAIGFLIMMSLDVALG
jgi:ZIP family zinc transporter